MAKHRFSLVACARREEMHIQEWVAYHESIGFDHIYLYSNDEDPAALFRAIAPYALGPDPFVTFRHWRHVGQQAEIYLHFLDEFKSETEWFSFLNIDEFLVFRDLDNVSAFMRDYESTVDCLYLNWLVYGHNGKLKREPGFTLMSYVRRAAKVDAHTKMICRSAAIDATAIRAGYLAGRGAFHHFLDNYRLPALRCADVLHASTDGYSADFPASAAAFATRDGYTDSVIRRAHVAHFQFRSEEDFLRCWLRGGFENDEYRRRLFDPGGHKAVLAENNVVYDTYLAEYWHRYAAPALRFGLEPPHGSPASVNIALNKPAFQSSVYEPAGQEPVGSRVSGGGNNGLRTGTYGFHTTREWQPWWCVDLLAAHRIAEIHVYNRCDDPAVAMRATPVEVLASPDAEDWTVLLSRTEAAAFGLDGAPLVVPVAGHAPFRFVLIRLPGLDYLHLDEVEVYGDPL